MPKSHLPEGLWAAAAALLLLAHASFYLYFFVDDEGITLMYARALLEGRGLTYAEFEGPTEGYSNFLHVIVMAGVLGATRLAGLDPIWAFAAGSLVSLACGAALVALVWYAGGRLGLPVLSRTAGAVLLAASGPLAVWSNSSLETVPFALAFMALVTATLPDVRPRAAALASIAVLLMRVDGALYVAVWLGARFLAGDETHRRQLMRSVAPPVIATAGVYAAARAWYFGSLLPLPLQAKIAHKLTGPDAAVVWTERDQYLRMFVTEGGWPLLLGVGVAAALAFRRSQPAAVVAAGAAIVVLAGYVGIVGDWMFGFRFFVPLLAPLALLCAYGVSLAGSRRRWLASVVAMGAIACAAYAALRFHAIYRQDQRKPTFWAVRSLDPALKFGEYYEAYRALLPLVTPGTRIAYHEAGFVPFLLGVENIDMLGLTSRFVGSSPTDDAILTDVGRYYPLTSEPPHHAVHAYLVFREPDLIVVRRRWMATANGGRVPEEIFQGYYRAEKHTSSFVIYRRTGRPIHPRRLGIDGFLENLAHPAYAERVVVNGAEVRPEEAADVLPSLWHGGSHEITADPAWTLRIDSRGAAPVHEVYIEGAPPTADLIVEVRLGSGPRGAAQRLLHTAARGEPLRVHHALDAPHHTEDIEIRFTSASGEAIRLAVHVVRVMGQTEDLRDHVRRHAIR